MLRVRPALLTVFPYKIHEYIVQSYHAKLYEDEVKPLPDNPSSGAHKLMHILVILIVRRYIPAVELTNKYKFWSS